MGKLTYSTVDEHYTKSIFFFLAVKIAAAQAPNPQFLDPPQTSHVTPHVQPISKILSSLSSNTSHT